MNTKNSKQIAVFIAIVTVCFGFMLYMGNRQANTNSMQDTLVVGVMSGFEPFCRINEYGEFEGFDIEVAKLIGEQLNKKIVFKDMGMAALILALQQQKIDLLFSSVSITEKRKEVIQLVRYQGDPVRAYPLLFWKNIPQNIQTVEAIAQLDNTVVATEDGQKEQFLNTVPNISVRAFSSINDIVMDVKYGKSIAMFLDPEIVPSLKKKNPELVSFDVPVPSEYQSEGFGIGINLHNNKLAKQVEQAIEILRDAGMIQKLERVWNLVEDK